MSKPKLVRITTIPESLAVLLKGQLCFMQKHYNVLAISSNGKALQDVKTNENVSVLPIDMSRQITPIKDIVSLVKLYKVLKKEKPFIVHTHTPKAGIIGMLAAYLANVPNRLHTIAGLPVMESKGIKRKILLFVEKLTYKSATQVFPNSVGLKDFVIENKLAKDDKLKIIGKGSSNGINVNHFNKDFLEHAELIALKTKLKIDKDDFVYIFVGRVVSDKGINELIYAFTKLSTSNSNVKLLIVGGFEQELDPVNPEVLKEIKSNSQIISVGFQKDVRPYFGISNCLVFPSYREGFPNVVMQAGAMGLVSIVSNINGCNEIIKDEKNGIIVPVKNTDAIYNAMSYLLQNPNELDKMQLNTRKQIVDNYQQEYIWNELLVTYKNL